MGLTINFRHVLTWPFGILQAAQFVLGIIVLICCASTHAAGGVGFVWFVCVSSLVCSLIFIFLYILNIPATMTIIPWILAELVSTGVWTIFYLIAFIVSAATSAQYSNIINTNIHEAMGAAAFFTLIGIGAYGFHAFLLWRTWRSGGGGVVSGPATTTSSEVKY